MKKTNETSKDLVFIDPPSGWKYGFPKSVTQEEYSKIKDFKAWCIANGYPKLEADSYGEHFHVGVSGALPSTELAIKWFKDLTDAYCQILVDKYLKGRISTSLTGREIEEIWRKECNQIEEEIFKNNQKQFKKFSSELFKAYIDKFSEEDKIKAFEILFDSCAKWDGINNAAPFYMAICRAFNAGKLSMKEQIQKGKEFKSSESYFKDEFNF